MKFILSAVLVSLLGLSAHASAASSASAASVRKSRLSETDQTAADIILRQVLQLHLLQGKDAYMNDDLRHALEGPDAGQTTTAYVAEITCQRPRKNSAPPAVGICTLFIRAFESEGKKSQSEVNYNLVVYSIGGHVATAKITDYAG